MPQIYTQKAVDVEAHQFNGWKDVADIVNWVYMLKPLYVPETAPHFLRSVQELNRTRQEVLGGAPHYLVLELEGKPRRVDPGSWIVRGLNSQVQVFTNEEFTRHYESPKPLEAN